MHILLAKLAVGLVFIAPVMPQHRPVCYNHHLRCYIQHIDHGGISLR
jgi:hypothetical protein